MSRRQQATKRTIAPDGKYRSPLVAKFINRVMMDGKKSIATKIVYSALEQFAEKAGVSSSLEAFERALAHATPTLEVKACRIGGATYQVPREIDPVRGKAIAMKWVIHHARSKVGKSMIDGLTLELLDCFNNQGATIKKKDDTHRMAESNKGHAHLKW